MDVRQYYMRKASLSSRLCADIFNSTMDFDAPDRLGGHHNPAPLGCLMSTPGPEDDSR